jgi:hypothetical protein
MPVGSDQGIPVSAEMTRARRCMLGIPNEIDKPAIENEKK